MIGQALDVIRRIAGEAGQKRIEHRIARMSSDDLVQWMDAGIAGVGAAFADWRNGGRNPAVDSLGEARVGAASVLLALEELDRRRAAGTL